MGTNITADFTLDNIILAFLCNNFETVLTGMATDCTFAVRTIESISVFVLMLTRRDITKFALSGCTVPIMGIRINSCFLCHFLAANCTFIFHKTFRFTSSRFYRNNNCIRANWLCMCGAFLKSTYFTYIVFPKIMGTLITANLTFSCLGIKCGMITVLMVTGSITNRTFSCFAVPYMGCFRSCFRHFCTTDSTDITYLSLLFTCCFY